VLVEVATRSDLDGLTEAHVEGGRVAYRGIYPDELLDGPSRRADRHQFWTETLDRIETGSIDAFEMLLVSKDRHGVAGMMHTKSARVEDAPSTWAAVSHLYVHPRAWRQGHGTALLRAAVGRLRDVGAEGILLWAVEDNLDAHRFYESRGWHIEPGHRRPLWGVPDVHEIQFKLEDLTSATAPTT